VNVPCSSLPPRLGLPRDRQPLGKRLDQGGDDEGSPFWNEAEQKFQLGVGNNWWLRRIAEDERGVKYRLDGRYTGTPERQAALEHLVQWLESDLVFGR